MAAKRKTTKKTTKRRATKTKSKSKSKSKAKSKSKSKSKTKKLPFGGYAISFSGRSETVEEVFGKSPVTPSEMTKRIWKFVKAKKLSNR